MRAALVILALTGLCQAESIGRGERLRPRALSEGLTVTARLDAFGLGAEAGRLSGWLKNRGDSSLIESDGGWSVRAGGETLSVSPALGLVLRRLNRFVLVEDEAKAGPVTGQELERVMTSPDGARAVMGLFDQAMAESLRIAGKVVIPEIGGEASLDGRIAYHRLEDPLRGVLREMLARRDDPAALRRLFEEHPEDMRLLDDFGTLKNSLATRARWDAEGRIPEADRRRLLRMAVDTVAQASVDRYTMKARDELEATLGHDWPGRYLGHWHLHPPDAGPDGWLDSNNPSDYDYDAASKNARELVIVFMRDGFDVHDLLDVGKEPPFKEAPFFSYRSPGWRPHFQAWFDRLK
jgi:hypothetical protein